MALFNYKIINANIEINLNKPLQNLQNTPITPSTLRGIQ